MPRLTLLLPEGSRLAPALPPTLAYWLARGDREVDAAPGRDTTLRSCFDFIGTAIPYAALTRSLDASDAGGALWLRADPSWIMADAVTLRLMACGDVGLSADESLELARALKPLFGDAGFPLEAATPSRWYLRCPPGAQLPAFSPPQAALGDDISRHLPDGDQGRRWHRLLNEAQVILHNHPVNASRAQRGIAPVNSVWFWGAGSLPDWVRTPATRVLSDDLVVRALAQLAKVPVAALDARALDAGVRDDDRVLIDLGAMRDAAALERGWLAPLQAKIATRVFSSVRLVGADGVRAGYRHAHRWRFWRRLPAAAA
jgi:hypothetical protein